MKKINKSLIATAFIAFSVISLTGTITAFAAGPARVDLGTAGNFVILSKTGVSTTGLTSIVGDLGVSPAAASYITGFALTLPSASAFSTSALVTGKVYAPDYANPTASNLTTAVLDMQTAYTNGSGRAPDVTELGAGNIGGLTIAPGVYKWGTGVTIPTDVTLAGRENDIWIFQIAQTLTVSSAVKVVLSGGAQASNIFWVVAGQTTIGTTAVFNGNILDQTAIVLNTGAKLNGRALAQTAVTLDANAVTVPASPAPILIPTTPPPTPTPPPTQITTLIPTPAPTQTPTQTTPEDARVVLQTRIDGLVVALRARRSEEAGKQIRTVANNLRKGSRGSDVNILQNYLISQNKGRAAEALANVGATAYFGSLTRAALAEFQAKAGISPALGNFGALTRAYVRANN